MPCKKHTVALIDTWMGYIGFASIRLGVFAFEALFSTKMRDRKGSSRSTVGGWFIKRHGRPGAALPVNGGRVVG